MSDYLLWILLALALGQGLALLWLLRRPAPLDPGEALRRELPPALAPALAQWAGQLTGQLERLERGLREAVQGGARDTRSELTQSMALFQQTLLTQSGDVARTQNEQIDSFRVQLGALQQEVAQALLAATESLMAQSRASSQAQAAALQQLREAQTQAATQLQEGQGAALLQSRAAQDAALHRVAEGLNEQLRQLREAQGQALAHSREAQDLALKRMADSHQAQLEQVRETMARQLTEVRQSVEQRLGALQEGNEKKLEQMRITVDEKLQATLEQRLGESFRQVAERLEQVHKGLGEMQALAAGVGDLKHLLSNVKTRGLFGEAQLGALLEQVLAPDQYAAQVVTRPGSKNPVDFAIRLPGRAADAPSVWLPIDAKFPNEDYERLLDAQGRADQAGAEQAGRALEARIRAEAKSIAEKYVEPPHTTEFGILFLPTEGLYAEVLRRPGLVEALQREHRITLAGPTTLMAMLNALHMGFRTLALERRSSEVWQVLGAVKTEFGKFGEVLSKVRAQTQTVLNTLDQAQTRTRVMTRALRSVEALPAEQTAQWLPASAPVLTGAESEPGEV